MENNLENRIKELQNEFDFAEPTIGHFERFEEKLQAQKKLKKGSKFRWAWMGIAASILLLLGFFLGNYNQEPTALELADVSPKMEETQHFYLATIQQEIESINKEKTPENQQIIEDAFTQLNKLEDNYKKLTIQLKESNEDKRVVFAMISNFQTRIEVLQNLMEQLDKLKELESSVSETII